MKDFYLYNWGFVILLFGFEYMVLFRNGMEDYFRLRKISKTKIRKSTKGMRNYWWYQQMHEEYGFDTIYWLNKIFTVATIPTLVLHIIFGWWKVMNIPVTVLIILCCMIDIPMNYFAVIQNNLYQHGTEFVIFERRKYDTRRGYDSIVFDVVQIVLPILIIYIEFNLLNSIWHFIK